MTVPRVFVSVSSILVSVLLGSNPVLAQERASKPAIAIADIEVRPGGWTLPPPDVGAAIAELLLAEFVSSAQFRVYDGQWLVPEGEGGARLSVERLRASALASRVDYVLLGTVTQFATERSSRGGGGILPARRFIAGALARRRVTTSVGVTIKLVDAKTGEIAATAVGNGRGRRTTRRFGVLGAIGLPFGGGGGSSSSARDAMLGEAIRDAVHHAALDLMKFAPPRRAGAEGAADRD